MLETHITRNVHNARGGEIQLPLPNSGVLVSALPCAFQSISSPEGVRSWYPDIIAWSEKGSFVSVEWMKRRQPESSIIVYEGRNGREYFQIPPPSFCPVWIDDYRLLYGVPVVTKDLRKTVRLMLLDCRLRTIKTLPQKDLKVRFPVLAFSSSEILALSSEGTVAEVVNLQDGSIRTLGMLPRITIGAVDYARARGHLVFVDAEAKTLRVLRYPTMRSLASIDLRPIGSVENIAWATPNHLVCTISQQGKAFWGVLDIQKGRLVSRGSPVYLLSYLSVGRNGFCVARVVRASGESKIRVALINWQRGRLERYSPTGVVAAALSSDGSLAAIIHLTQDGGYRLRVVPTLNLLKEWR